MLRPCSYPPIMFLGMELWINRNVKQVSFLVRKMPFPNVLIKNSGHSFF